MSSLEVGTQALHQNRHASNNAITSTYLVVFRRLVEALCSEKQRAFAIRRKAVTFIAFSEARLCELVWGSTLLCLLKRHAVLNKGLACPTVATDSDMCHYGAKLGDVSIS